ncbi:MAG: carbohydrate kinase family protein [Anaerolineaceae bacterium 4572_78]|nr:MAG: carbohydrate kinase family protein [Anaerolineaceae bacterium 4572_78]
MNSILVAGLINIETTLQIEMFPLNYNPANYPFFGINTSVSGVGYNVAKALTVLGHQVKFLSAIGTGMHAQLVREILKTDNISDDYILDSACQTAQSVILYDKIGQRQIHVDLKDIQEIIYPQTSFEQAMKGCDLLALCNVNFTRPFLSQVEESDTLVATDVHAISNLEDKYNRDYMQRADILFMSDELLPISPEAWAKAIFKRYNPSIVVIGLGRDGALLGVQSDDFIKRFSAVYTRPIVNTIGAGDALFSAFLHSYLRCKNPYHAIKKAIVFASYKIGVTSAADGFLTAEELEQRSKLCRV